MPSIILQSLYSDGSVAFQHTSESDDLTATLAWATANWHPAQGGRVPGTTRFYLNPALQVSIDGAEFEPVYSALARLHTPVGLAA
jgi:hypothetical protein